MTIQYEAVSRLAPDESLVWDALSTSHRGRGEAITQASLSTVVGMPARSLRRVIKSLIQTHGLPIGSAPDWPAGYFVIETQHELAKTADRYRRQALSLLYREMRLRKMTAHQLARQIEMELNR